MISIQYLTHMQHARRGHMSAPPLQDAYYVNSLNSQTVSPISLSHASPSKINPIFFYRKHILHSPTAAIRGTAAAFCRGRTHCASRGFQGWGPFPTCLMGCLPTAGTLHVAGLEGLDYEGGIAVLSASWERRRVRRQDVSFC
jgi:hypothetical protein